MQIHIMKTFKPLETEKPTKKEHTGDLDSSMFLNIRDMELSRVEIEQIGGHNKRQKQRICSVSYHRNRVSTHHKIHRNT